MLLRPWNTRLCALKLTLHHAVGEGHDIAFARCRKLDDRPSDLLSAFVFIGGEPEYKGGGGECLIHNFDLFGTESCPLQETDYFHEVVPELPGAHMGSIQPPTTGFLENVHEWRAAAPAKARPWPSWRVLCWPHARLVRLANLRTAARRPKAVRASPLLALGSRASGVGSSRYLHSDCVSGVRGRLVVRGRREGMVELGEPPQHPLNLRCLPFAGTDGMNVPPAARGAPKKADTVGAALNLADWE
jgi:hypothetical protein